jgi:hypothetical protein
MNKAFKFPPSGGSKSPGLTISPPPAVPPVPPIIIVHEAKDSVASMKEATGRAGASKEVKRVMPEPPTPDLANPAGGNTMGRGRSDSDADVGETVEIDLS